MGAVAANTIVSWTDSDGGDHDGSLVTRAKGFDVIACAICGNARATAAATFLSSWLIT